MTLFERIQRYEGAYDGYLIPRLPIIVRCSARNFPRLIRKLPRPYCPELWWVLRSAMHTTVMELEGAVFAYQAHGELSYVLKSMEEDTPGPYGSKIQKIGTVVSSLTTLNFMKHFLASDDPPDIIGEAVFEGLVFSTPSVSEATNYLINQQQLCYRYAVSSTAEEEMSRQQENIDFLNRKSTEEKKEILQDECGIIFDTKYKSLFRHGSCSFKAPKIIRAGEHEIVRKKWVLEENAPDFIRDRDFLVNILNCGQDIMRPERDLHDEHSITKVENDLLLENGTGR